MRLAQMLVNRHILKIGFVGLAALLFFSAGLVGQVVMLAIAGAIVWAWWGVKGEKAGLIPTVLVRGLAWAGNALATFGARLATTRWGQITGGTLGVLMLADASYGNDGVGLPIIGWPLGVIVALVVGGREWSKRRPYVERVEDAVRSAVAVLRKLSVLLHRLWVTGEVYEPLYNARRAQIGAA